MRAIVWRMTETVAGRMIEETNIAGVKGKESKQAEKWDQAASDECKIHFAHPVAMM